MSTFTALIVERKWNGRSAAEKKKKSMVIMGGDRNPDSDEIVVLFVTALS